MNAVLLMGLLFKAYSAMANSARDSINLSKSLETLTVEHADTQMAVCVSDSFRSSEQHQCGLERDKKGLSYLYVAAQESEDAGNTPYDYNASARAMLVVCGLFIVAAVAGSAVDVVLQSTGQAGPKRYSLSLNLLNYISAFSLFKNVRAILTSQQPPSTISCLNGIRVMSMFWIILCHVHVWSSAFSPPSDQVVLERDILPRLWYQVILNGYFAVDSFFLLSGTVAAYNHFRAMKKRKIRFPFFDYYVHRYLRLTMVYAFVVFSRHLVVYLSDALSIQLLTSSENQNYKNCDQYWWTNLLYVNNIYPWRMRDECMFWTWSMANDMQFYVIAPLVLIPLYHSYRKGLTVVGLLLASSFLSTGIIVGINDFSPVSALQPFTSDGKEQTDEIYIKPYCRIPPYLVGSLLGSILHNRVQLPFQGAKKNLCYVVLWSVAVITFAAIIFGLYGTWYGYKMSMTENILFYTFSHFAWGIGVALVVFACHNGYGWIINDFLSMKIWIPLSRLTYNVSLIHPIILDIILGPGKQISTHWDTNLVICTVVATALSYSAAGVLAVLVEYPLSNVERLVFKIIGIHREESVRLVSLTF